MDEAHNTLLLAEKYMGKLGSEFSRLSKIKLSDAKVMEYIDLLLPMDDEPTEIHRRNISRIREDMKLRYFDAPDLRYVGKNAYRFVCAVSDFATHAEPTRKTANYRENMFAKTIDGNPLIDRAYEIVREAAYWGTQLESLVKAEFTKRTGLDVTPVNQLLQSEEHSFMLANLDGVCAHPDYGTCVFEAKTASAYKASEWDNKIPDEYQLQIQHYMAVTGYMGAYIAVLIGGNTFRWKFIERDEMLINMLIRVECEFWNCVQTSTPPPLDGSDASARFLSERFPESVPLSKIELPDKAAALVRRYDAACEKVARYTEQKQKVENQLKQMIGENEAGTAGDRLITWKTVTQERLDSKTLKSEHPTLYKKYANKTSYRRFSVKAAS